MLFIKKFWGIITDEANGVANVLASLQLFHCSYKYWQGNIWQIKHLSSNLSKFPTSNYGIVICRMCYVGSGIRGHLGCLSCSAAYWFSL